MSSHHVFVDRRNGQDRRTEDASPQVPSEQPKQKHRSQERRDKSRSLIDDYHAYMRRTLGKADYVEPKPDKARQG